MNKVIIFGYTIILPGESCVPECIEQDAKLRHLGIRSVQCSFSRTEGLQPDSYVIDVEEFFFAEVPHKGTFSRLDLYEHFSFELREGSHQGGSRDPQRFGQLFLLKLLPAGQLTTKDHLLQGSVHFQRKIFIL